MDITEAFRGEDISKTDFFDFVTVTPDIGEHQQSLHLNRTLRSMGIFIENSHTNSGNNNEMSSFQEIKETNNNHLMMTTSSDNVGIGGVVNNFADHPFWSSPTCDKETVRLETAILEDLNKFCWSQDSDVSGSSNGTCHKGGTNTDGAIYTLTVLNGGDHSATWYRAPEAPPPILKEEDENQQQPLSSPNNMDCQQIHSHADHPNHTPTLDLDSILSIIPNQTQTTNGHQFHPNGYHHHHQHHTNDASNTLSPHHIINHEGLIKSEQQYTYDDSGFANSKDCNATMTHIVDTPSLMETSESNNFNNNNNDWKLSNNNSNSSADSLLRSALQGKNFLGRYNGTPKCGAAKILEVHSELRRVLATPPAGQSGSKTPLEGSPVFEVDDCDKKMVESNSMDDILLSQLDAASYPEDYEKLKRIAHEVAESVSQYCSLDGAYMASPILAGLPSSVPPPTLKPGSKKYSKKPSGGVKGGALPSNGIRKERSLHYCNICSKGFKDKYSVNVHIRTHTGEKPFACSLCGKSFRQKAHLAKHYQTHIAQKNGTSSNGAPKAATSKARYSTPKPS